MAFSLLVLTFNTESIPSTSYLPAELQKHMGFYSLLTQIPFVDVLVGNHLVLMIIQHGTQLALVGVILGWRLKITLPVACLGYFCIAAILRQYSWFYHTGLIPWLSLVTLAFFPSGDALRIGKKDVRDSSSLSNNYGWGLFCVWATIAIPYMAAGLSKLRFGGLWWEGANIQGHMLQTALDPMAFDFGWAVHSIHWPHWILVILGLSAVFGELAMILVLFSRTARMVLPAVMVLMHIGILFLQNILFLDLILIQAVFYVTLFDRFVPQSEIGSGYVSARSNLFHRGKLVLMAWVTLLVTSWMFTIEFFPLTSMRMFSKRADSGTVVYYELWQQHPDGRLVKADPSVELACMDDSRYRRYLSGAFSPNGAPQASAFFRSWVSVYNEQSEANKRIVRLILVRKQWNYREDPDSESRSTREFKISLDLD
ncbi:MAG: hypothetical protein AAFX93_16570 [Verrucomicrobiota bacterium]